MLTALLFNARDMLHDWIRTLINVISLAVIVVSYLLLSSLARTLDVFAKQPGISSNLIIIENQVMDPSDARVDAQTLAVVKEYAPQMVSRVSPTIFRYTRIAGHLIQVRAAPFEDWSTIYGMSLLAGDWPTAPKQVVAGEGAADANHWKIGTVITIFGSDFQITGISRLPGTQYAAVWMTLEEAQGLYGITDYNALVARLAPGVDAEKVRTDLLADPRLAERFTVFFEDSFTRRNAQGASDMHSLMIVISWIALIAVAFGTFNATNLSLAERSREVGILRAIGFTEYTLRGVLLLQSLLQALAAFLVGVSVTLFYTLGPQNGGSITIFGAPFDMKLTLPIALSGLGLVMAFASLGSWLPTRAVMRQNVADTFWGKM